MASLGEDFRTFLLASSDIAARVGTRVYQNEVQQEEGAAHGAGCYWATGVRRGRPAAAVCAISWSPERLSQVLRQRSAGSPSVATCFVWKDGQRSRSATDQ